MLAIIPNWIMYIVIFIGSAFFGRAILMSLIYFINLCIRGIQEFLSNPSKYINNRTIHEFFNGVE